MATRRVAKPKQGDHRVDTWAGTTPSQLAVAKADAEAKEQSRAGPLIEGDDVADIGRAVGGVLRGLLKRG